VFKFGSFNSMTRYIIAAFILLSVLAQESGCVYAADAGIAYTSAQCVECHEDMAADQASSTVHKDIECLGCHAQAALEDHETVAPVDCRQCHAPHAEKILHDAHTRVTCKACHLKGGVPEVDSTSGSVIWCAASRAGAAFQPHQMARSQGDKLCGNCHFRGNSLGASAMILPPKSILCLPCHVATLSVDDKTTLVSLFLFLVGMAGLSRIWFSSTNAEPARRPGIKTNLVTGAGMEALFSKKIPCLLRALIFDVFLLKRLFRLSPTRWAIHGLIFYPFLIRFTFGLAALLLSLFLPDGSLTGAMLDKNHAVRAFLFDFTGLMIIAGAIGAIFREKRWDTEKIVFLPEAGRFMTALLGLVVLVGFILEGLRIAMTGYPPGAGFAFMGYGISLLLKGMLGLTDTYGYMWYAHAILVGAFVALIPFTRMSHIITAPIVLIINTSSETHACSAEKINDRKERPYEHSGIQHARRVIL
jgi:hypothetical protein